MGIFCEFKKVNQDRSVFINASQIVMVSHGAVRGTTMLELAGQRTFDVQGAIDEIMRILEEFGAAQS